MLGRLLAPSISLIRLPDASSGRSLASTAEPPLFQKKGSWASQRKRPREDCGPAWPSFHWLNSPAEICRRCRPSWLFNGIIPSVALQKNFFLGACQSYRGTFPSASIRIGLHPNEGDDRQFRFFSS